MVVPEGIVAETVMSDGGVTVGPRKLGVTYPTHPFIVIHGL